MGHIQTNRLLIEPMKIRNKALDLNLNLPSNVKVEAERDSLGGRILDSDIYSGKLDVVFLDYSESGAMNVNIHFKTNNQVFKQQVYISNKAGEFTYADKRDNGKATPLPGYTEMVSFFQAVTGKSITDQPTEDKMVKIWDSKQKAEVPKKVKVFTACTGQAVAIGVQKISEEKTVKSDKGYVGTGEFRDTNRFDKFFDGASGLTNVEKAAGETEPAFALKWKEANKGKVKTKKAKVSGVPAGAAAGAPAASGAGNAKLFS